jgi:hypothetical protein
MRSCVDHVTFLTAVMRLVERIKPILVGRPPALQGAALAECLALVATRARVRPWACRLSPRSSR